MTAKALFIAASAAAAIGSQAVAQESWTMTTTWPSSLELIETDKHFVDLANTAPR